MATLREIRRRISGVKSTQKITKAMKMVAAAKLRRAQEAILAARPYARTMRKLLGNLALAAPSGSSPLFEKREVHRSVVVVVTGDRGLCGAFNSNVIRAAADHIKKLTAPGSGAPVEVRVVVVGKKGADHFGKRGFDIAARHVGIFGNLQFPTAQSVAHELTEWFKSGTVDHVDVVYNEFKNVVQQKTVIEQFLPIAQSEVAGKKEGASSEYIYEPSSAEILSELLPKHLNFQMWRILLESNAAEQGARMSAMGNATENAKELIRVLTLSYNKARQAGITKELLEIVSGAEALKKAG